MTSSDVSGLEQNSRPLICKGCGNVGTAAHQVTCVRAALLNTLNDFLQDLESNLDQEEIVLCTDTSRSWIRLENALVDLDILNTEAQRELDNA